MNGRFGLTTAENTVTHSLSALPATARIGMKGTNLKNVGSHS
jgi:hypothetical protein